MSKFLSLHALGMSVYRQIMQTEAQRAATELKTINGVEIDWITPWLMKVGSKEEVLKVLAGRTCSVAICWRDAENPEVGHLIPAGQNFTRLGTSESFIWTPIHFQVNSGGRAGESYCLHTKEKEGIAA